MAADSLLHPEDPHPSVQLTKCFHISLKGPHNDSVTGAARGSFYSHLADLSLSSAPSPLPSLLSCSLATLQVYSSPEHRAELSIETITTCCPHVCGEQADQSPVRILAIGTFTFSLQGLS